jgi:hypothetical protein
MTRRIILVLMVAALGLAAGWLLLRSRPVAPAPSATASVPLAQRPIVPIEDHKTIDFSNGQPVVRTDAENRAVIAKAEIEMAAAADTVTFAPIGPQPATPAKTDPSKAREDASH